MAVDGVAGRGVQMASALVQPRASLQTRAGWDDLVRQHDRRVVVSLLARGLPIDRARELAQETWRRLYERDRAGELQTLDLPGLAIRQAGFLAVDEHRRQRLAPELRDVLPDARELRPDAEAATITRERMHRTQRILNAASPSARNVFRLVYGEGLDHASTAARLGLSVQRVRQIVCEVRRDLRAAFGEEQ